MKTLIVLAVITLTVAPLWAIHLIADLPGQPYASTQIFLEILTTVGAALIGVVLWKHNEG